jgi:anti-anti-sigma regulatory factor
MLELIQRCKTCKPEKPAYLDSIQELPKVDIIRLKGKIDRTTIPSMDTRIKANRRAGSKIDKNVVLDFSKVDDVDSATIAFHIVRLKEYRAKGFDIGFININAEMQALLDLFKENGTFKIFPSEAEAVTALNR